MRRSGSAPDYYLKKSSTDIENLSYLLYDNMKDFQQGGAGMNILACNSSLESVYIDQPYFIEHPGSVIHILYGWLVIFISFLFDKFLIKSSNILRFLLCSFLYLSIYLSIDSLIFSRLSPFCSGICMLPATQSRASFFCLLPFAGNRFAPFADGSFTRNIPCMRQTPRLPCITSDVP